MKNKHSLISMLMTSALVALIIALSSAEAGSVFAQQFSRDLFQSLRWRSIGPFRGGRTRAVAGVPAQPNVFYMAQVNGGVWKTDDYGHTWAPIFDDQPTGSVGSIAVAPSDPNVIYVGSGEGLQRPDLSVGDGIYKSTDAGRTWTHLGLRDGQQIPQIAVDPGGDIAEIDVRASKRHEVVCIECKGKSPGSVVSRNEIEYWLAKTIPRIKYWLKSRPDIPVEPRFEFYATTDYDEEADHLIRELRGLGDQSNSIEAVMSLIS